MNPTSQLSTEEIHALTAGTLGHLVDVDQLKFIAHFIKARIKFLLDQNKKANMPVIANSVATSSATRGARTVKDIADRLGVDLPIAYGLVKFLEAKGILVNAGTAVKAPNTRGKGASIYTLSDDPSCQVEIDNFLNFLNSSF